MSWIAISAIAAAVAALASTFGIVLTASQNNANWRRSSFKSAQDFESDCRTLWANTRKSICDFDENVLDIIALFELHIIGLQEKNPSKPVRDYITETICDYLAKMADLNAYYDVIITHTVDRHVCENLKDFIVQYQSNMLNRKRVGSMLNVPSWSIT